MSLVTRSIFISMVIGMLWQPVFAEKKSLPEEKVSIRKIETQVNKDSVSKPEKTDKDVNEESRWILGGRIRTNSFFHDRKGAKADYGASFGKYAPENLELYDPRGFVTLLGLSLQSPERNHFSIFANHFFGTDFGTLDHDDARYGKSGKDTFVRNTTTNEPMGFNVLAQLYLKYKKDDLDIRAGRMIFDTILTNANDSKAVPNTFVGLSLKKKRAEQKDSLIFAFLTQQKLRNRNSFHDLLVYGTTEADNDDSGMHKGLTRARVEAAGKPDPRLIIFGWEKFEKKRHARAFVYAVPQFFSTLMVEGKWQLGQPVSEKAPVLSGWLRVFQQKDQGAGAIGGGKIDGTATPAAGSLDANIWMAKLQANWKVFEAWLGYSKVADKGDIVAPWRGYPTHMFTRNMTDLNWTSGTKSTMLACTYNLDKARILKGGKLIFDFANYDRLETPGKVSQDAKTWHTDFVYKIPRIDVEMKIRYLAHFGKAEQDFRDSRLEFNHFF